LYQLALAEGLSDGIVSGLWDETSGVASGEVAGAIVGAELLPVPLDEHPATSKMAMSASVAVTTFMSMAS
jgi:hypothetical protein